MKACEELESLGIERCPECHCPIGEDWQYDDYSNKNIISCPQCHEKIFIEEEER
jgi:DNA-directed RNA polymerase subunit RPC12/RpoP